MAGNNLAPLLSMLTRYMARKQQ